MSDLQCPCTALVVRPAEADRAHEVAERVRDRRVARVFTARDDGAEATAGVVAEALQLPVEVLDSGASGMADALAAVSDSYRGETVLVVCDPDRLGRPYAGHELAEIAIDGDGWALVGD